MKRHRASAITIPIDTLQSAGTRWRTLRACCATSLLVLVFLGTATACQKATVERGREQSREQRHEQGREPITPPQPGETASADSNDRKANFVRRGSPLTGAPTVALATLLAKPEPHAGTVVTLEGTVRQACQRKGCWMELAEEPTGPGVRVRFKDYAFFVPTASAGLYAKLQGEVKIAELSESHAAHYAEEGATIPRGPDGKPREVQIIATGVELHDKRGSAKTR